MKNKKMKNKISQMLYRSKKENPESEKDFDSIEKLDAEIDKALHEFFGTKRKKK